MTNLEDIDMRDHLKMPLFVLKYLLYWPPYYNKKILNFVYNGYSASMVSFLMILFNIMECINIVIVSGDLEKMLNVSYLLVTNTTQLLQVGFYVYYGKKIQNLVNELNHDAFKPKSKEDLVIIKKSMGKYISVSRLYMGLSAVTCILFGISPIIDNKVREKELPFDYYYPYDTKKSPAYELTFLYQALSMLHHAITHVAVDSIYTGIMVFIGIQMDVLANNLSKLEEVDLADVKTTSVDVDISKMMNNNLISCVHKHRHILKIANKLNKYVAVPLLAQFVLGSVILCVAMFQMSKLPPTSAEFASCLLYLLAMALEIFLYCWYGNEVLLKSSSLHSAIFKCQWMSTARYFKKNMLFFMVRTGNPIRIYAGYFIPLSLQSFGSIIRGAWSYFAVLKSMQNDE